MATTEPKPDRKSDRLVKEFFFDELMPLAERFSREGREQFPMKPDPSASSYWIVREKTRMDSGDFEEAGRITIENLADELTRFWRSRGSEDLATLAPSVARLARRLHDVGREDDELSPSVYVMY